MDLDALQIGFIGCGRLAKALAWHCGRRGLRVTAAASLARSEAEDLAQRLPGCAVLEAQQVADRCDLVFVTTPDEAIRRAADKFKPKPDFDPGQD